MLEEVIKENIENIEKGQLSDLVFGYHDYKTKYAFLKNKVIVRIELVSGKTADVDITDYFFNKEGEMK